MPKRFRVCALQRRTVEWRRGLTLRIHCENVWVAVRDICGSCIRDRAVMCNCGLKMRWILATCGWVRSECAHVSQQRLLHMNQFWWNDIVVSVVYASSPVYLNYMLDYQPGKASTEVMRPKFPKPTSSRNLWVVTKHSWIIFFIFFLYIM